MEASQAITIVTNEASILRYLKSIMDEKLPFTISSLKENSTREFTSSIVRIENEHKQILLHQLLPSGWHDEISINEDIQISCHMPLGTIKFLGKLSPLEESENGIYCRLTIPDELTKKQLRSYFRVSLNQYLSEVSLELEEGTQLSGTCQDLSQNGALFFLPETNENLQQGRLIEKCHLVVNNVLDIECPAEVCHVKNTSKNNMLVGLKFIDLGFDQLKAIRPAMNKLERNNIVHVTS